MDRVYLFKRAEMELRSLSLRIVLRIGVVLLWTISLQGQEAEGWAPIMTSNDRELIALFIAGTITVGSYTALRAVVKRFRKDPPANRRILE